MSNYVDYDNAVELFTEVGNKRKASESMQESLLKSTVGWTGKNKLHYDLESLKSNNTSGTWNNNVYTVNKTHFTVNDDLSISVTTDAEGASADAVFDILDSNLAAGSYKASGCTNGSVSTYILLVYNDNYSGVNYVTDGDTDITLTGSTMRRVRMLVKSGQIHTTALLFEPMIRDASITDDTYEPYHESVETMYEEEIHGVNLIKNVGPSNTINGVTFTVNADGSATANGTATAQCWFSVKDYLLNPLHLDAGSYFVNGCSGGSSSTYSIRLTNGASALATSYGGETAFNLSSSSDSIGVYIVIDSNQTVSNLVFKPMIRKAEIEDSTYRPYNEQAIQNQINAQGVLGAKNLLKYPYHHSLGVVVPVDGSVTIAGITYTVNSDYSVTANGTATSASYMIFNRKQDWADFDLYGKKVKLSVKPVQANVFVQLYNADTSSMVVKTDANGEVEFTFPDSMRNNTSWNISLNVPTGNTVNNVKFECMLTLASDPDDTYVPYAMTNRELTEKANTYGMVLPSTTDLNNIIENGIYFANNVNTNAPTGISSAYYGLIVMSWGENNIRQLLIAKDVIYTRSKGGSPVVWSSWYKYTGTVVS